MGDDLIERMNWSTLKHLDVSPALLKYRLEHPRPDTDALRLGRAIHCALLEPEIFPSRWVGIGQCMAVKKSGDQCGSTGSLWKDGSWYCKVRGHAPDGATDSPEGVEILTAEALELATLCADRVKAHKIAAGIIDGGRMEERVEWTHEGTGIACKGRLDCIKPNYIVDLKTTRRETLREFIMDAARNLYHCQLAWYHDGAIAAGRLPKDADLPYIVVVTTTEPYDVAVFQLSKATYQAGQIRYEDLLKQYEQCRAADWWPGFAPDLVKLELPQWAAGMMGSEEDETADDYVDEIAGQL